MKTNETYINALLADATYVHRLDPDRNLKEALSERMTPSLAQYIYDRFVLVTQIETGDFDISSGFDATIWRRKEDGKIYVSMRGTEPVTDLVIADVDLTFTGLARYQLVDMVNWWLRETAPAGRPVMQIAAVGGDLNPLTPARFVAAPMAMGTGRVTEADIARGIEVNGHSLGGYLSTVFARLFGRHSNIAHVSTFNGAGITRGTELSFKQLEALVGAGYGLGGFADGNLQSNYFARHGVNVTTNTSLFAQQGRRIEIFNELSVWQAPNHFMYKMTDALAFSNALEVLDDSLSLEKANTILEMGAASPNASIEGAFDALNRMIKGPQVASLEVGDDSDSAPTRVAYHAALAALQQSDSFRSLQGKVKIERAGLGLTSAARTDFSAMVSLLALSPFVLRSINPATAPVYRSAWASEYAAWAADRLISEQDQPGFKTYSGEWLRDRAHMVDWIAVGNEQDAALLIESAGEGRSVSATVNYEDKATGTQRLIGIGLNAGRQQIIFGGGASERLIGLDMNDHLYGGLGNDTLLGGKGGDYVEGGGGDDELRGGEGNDRLLGGTGSDKYVFESDFGTDFVFDDGGIIEIVGVGRIDGSDAKKVGSVWRGSGGKVSYGQQGGNLVINYYSPEARAGGSIILKGWVAGAFGISLGETGLEKAGGFVLDGDYEKDLDRPRDQYNNYRSKGPKPGGDDVLFGGVSEDLLSGLDGDDVLQGRKGGDFLEGGKGTDLIYGGLGEDTLIGGDGMDFLYGSGFTGDKRLEEGSDRIVVDEDIEFLTRYSEQDEAVRTHPESFEIIARGYAHGDDHWVIYRVPGQTEPRFGRKVWRATTNVNAARKEGDQSNVLDSGEGDDIVAAGSGDDLVSGGGGDDDLFGMGGSDVVWGGAGKDLIFGDAQDLLRVDETEYLDGPDAWGAKLFQQGDDTLDGGQGDDFVFGQGGDDNLFGSEGDDSLYGDWGSTYGSSHSYDGADFIEAGNGNDTAVGGGGNDLLYGGGGNDYVYGDAAGSSDADPDSDGTDTLFGGDGDDQIVGGGAADTLYGGDGADSLFGDHDNTSIVPLANHADDYLDGGVGSDTLMGGGGADCLFGGEGGDELIGGDGGDTLVGGAGTDILDGGAGDDTYMFGSGDIEISEGLSDYVGTNTVVVSGLGAVTAVDVQGGTLVLQFNGGQLLGVGGGASGSVRTYEIDGTSYGFAQLIAAFQPGPTYVIDDFGRTFATGSRGVDRLHGYAGRTSFYGGFGDDTMEGSGGGNKYTVGRGHGRDTIIDTSKFASALYDLAGSDAKTAALEVIAPSRIVFEDGIHAQHVRLRSQEGLVVSVVGEPGEILITGTDLSAADAVVPIDEFEFADGRVLSFQQFMALGFENDGTDTDETQTGTAFVDRFSVSAGNDTMIGGSGSDIYAWGHGAGQDVIADISSNADIDTIAVSAGLVGADLVCGRVGDDLIIRVRDGADSIRVNNHFTTGAIDRLEFANDTVWTSTDIAARITNELTELADTFTGTVNADYVDSKGGNDSVRGLGGDDQIFGGAGNDTLVGDDGNDLLIGGAGTDSIVGGEGRDTLDGRGDAAADDLVGGNGADVYLFGRGSGSDRINESVSDSAIDVLRFQVDIAPTDVKFDITGPYSPMLLRIVGTNDTIRFAAPNLSAATGLDRIEFAGDTSWGLSDWLSRYFADQATSGNDTLQGFETSDFMIGADGNDYITGQGGHDSVDGGNGHDSIFGGAGNDTLIGGAGTDSLDGGDGDDMLREGETMQGGAGNDIYALTNWSNVQISEVLDIGSVGDALDLAGTITLDSLDILRPFYDNKTLVLQQKTGGTNSIQVNDFYNGKTIEAIRFADGTTLSYASVIARDKSYQFTSGADSIKGFDWNETLKGLAGNDTIGGFVGNDSILGGDGDDVLYGDSSLNTSLIGTDGNDTIDGGAGNDLMWGGGGNDVFQFAGGYGSDRITDVGGTDKLVLGPGSTPAAISLISDGSALYLCIVGVADQLKIVGQVDIAAQKIESIEFADGTVWDAATIVSKTQIGTANTMTGTVGNDTFVIDHIGDRINELPNQGIDTVVTAVVDVSLELMAQANIENITLTGDLNLNVEGNALANIITGNAGSNVIRGGYNGGGRDTMRGGAGDDIYYASELGSAQGPTAGDDAIVELASEGFDTVVTNSYDYALPDGVEVLIGQAQTGWKDWNNNPILAKLTGNASANVIYGHINSNVPGNLIDGGAGADTMIGGAGNDTFIVDSVNDVVVEAGNGGTDTVQSSATLTLAAHVEYLVLTGSAAINGVGNVLNNRLAGNAAANTLDGGVGNDTMVGGAGNDTYIVDAAEDAVVELPGEGDDLVQATVTYALAANVEHLRLMGTSAINGNGNAFNNWLVGNAAANILDGGAGTDNLLGGAGDDTYVLDVASDVVTENFNCGIDTVRIGTSYALTSNVESLVLTGMSVINGTGNTLDNRLTGNAAANTLNGGAGSDTMLGGAGDDIYIVDTVGDAVVEGAGEGSDLVQASVSYTLAAEIERLTLSDASAIDGTGNSLANVLIGNRANNQLTGGAGNDTLDGGLGNDIMVGGVGDDIYVVDSSADVVAENVGEGSDLVQATISYALGTNVEHLRLMGSAAINGSGNAFNNWLIGNQSDNQLNGGAGGDVLDGGLGMDTLIGGTGADDYRFGRGYGTDKVVETDAAIGVKDIVRFGAGIVQSDVRFTRNGNALVASLIGTGDALTLQDWYLGNQYHAEEFRFVDGSMLTDAQAQSLVQAMASFSPTVAQILRVNASDDGPVNRFGRITVEAMA